MTRRRTLGRRIRRRLKTAGSTVTNIAKDVGTSTTRIVTDTVLDVGNVATGFQFDDQLSKAKQAMSEAGIRTAAEAIEDNHYGFLSRMEAEVRHDLDALHALRMEGLRLEVERLDRATDLFGMLAQVHRLAQMSRQARSWLESAVETPAWRHRPVDRDALNATVRAIDESAEQWEQIGRLALASGIVGAASVTADIGSGRALARAAKLAQAAKLARGS